MNICKSEKSLRMHCFFLHVPECQEKCDNEKAQHETNDLPRSLIIYNKYYYNEERFPSHVAREMRCAHVP